MIEIIAGLIAVVLFCIMSIFQLLLAVGLPLGQLAYGGKYEKLPNNLRIMSLSAIAIFVYEILVILERVGFISIFNNTIIIIISLWIIAFYLAFNTVLNAISRSKWEKLIMTPISLTLTVCCFIVAIIP
jgi:hypothetical protein